MSIGGKLNRRPKPKNVEMGEAQSRSTPTTGSVSLNSEVGILGEQGMAQSKSVTFGSKITNPKRR